MAGYDLHTHTRYSDGTTTPEHNVVLALQLGLEGIALTDHDTFDGWPDARRAADGAALEVVEGTEFSAELDGWSVHVLGFWPDPAHAELAAELARLRDERTDRARRIVARLAELGVEVAFERVVELAGEAPIGRPHIAQAVLEAGHAASLREVFDRWLADGGPAHVAKHAVDPARAVELLVRAGGVAVLAHPGLHGRDAAGLPAEEVERLAAAGLAGIEADHPDHDELQRRRYRDLAWGLGLVVTAGSDYHGDAKTNRLGSAVTPRAELERLRERRAR